MRLLCMTILLACAMLSKPPSAAGGSSPNAFCPNVLLMESTSGRYYLVSFSTHVRTKAAVDMTLYAKDAAYAVSVPSIDIARPVPMIGGIFRSPAVVIKNPANGELLAATVRPSPGAHNFACPGENVLIPSVASLTAPDRHVAPAADALESQLAAEAPSAKPVLLPVPAPGEALPACSVPFADASVDQLAKPNFPREVRNDANLQPIAVRVELDERGTPIGASIDESSGSDAADAIALDAARRSTYHAARFGCKAERSSHVIRVDFPR